jgi:hypothetical protein
VVRVHRFKAEGLLVEVRVPGSSTVRIGERETVLPDMPEWIQSQLLGAQPLMGADQGLSSLSLDIMMTNAALGRVGSIVADQVEAEIRAGTRGEACRIAGEWLERGVLRFTGKLEGGPDGSYFNVKLAPAVAERLRGSLGGEVPK